MDTTNLECGIVPAVELVVHKDFKRVRMESKVVAPNPISVNDLLLVKRLGSSKDFGIATNGGMLLGITKNPSQSMNMP